MLRLIRIADARFQEGLAKQAKQAGKVRADFKIPAHWKDNTPAAVRNANAAGEGDWFPAFPFGRDFTDEELTLGKALGMGLKAATGSRRGKLATLGRPCGPRMRKVATRRCLSAWGCSGPPGCGKSWTASWSSTALNA